VSNFDSDMRKEKEVQYALQRQFDIKIKDLEQSHNETVAMVTRQKDEILKIFVECHRMSANSGV
jgi:hypothetical protein